MINLLNSILFNAKRHENTGEGNSQVLHVEASDFTRIPSVTRRSTDGESQRAYSVSMRSIRFAALLFLFFMVGAGNVWGAHQYILPVTSTTSYGGSSVERKIDNYTWVVYQANNFDNWVDFHLNVASAADYFFYVGVSSDRGGNFRPYTNDKPRGEHGFSNSGWYNVRETNCGTNGVLQAGDNKISICNNGNNFNLYYVRLADAINTNLTVPSDLGIYFWEIDGSKNVTNSDFSYSNSSDYMDYNGYSGKVAFKNSNTTATSRYSMVFPTTGTYQFIFPVYVKDNGTYSYPIVRVDNNSTSSGSITTATNNKLDSITLELNVTAGTYPVYIDFPATDKVFYRYVSVVEKPSVCTAPHHVDISGEWGRFGGETISLTATAYSSAGSGSPIDAGDITGYQWQKLVGSTWTNVTGANVTGATSANLQISNCDKNNSGKYRCVVSTGATCSTASATATDGSQGFQVRVYTLECYTGGSTDYNFTRVGVANRGTVEVTLSASTTYQFKIHGDDYFGNNGTINEDVTDWDFETGKNNVQVASGLGGTFTFTIDYSANGAVPDVSVTYPRKRIYFSPGVWKTVNDGEKFAYHYFRDGCSSGWTDFLTEDDCGMYADIPQWNGVILIPARLKNTTVSPGSWDDRWNQTNNITVNSNDYVSITGWNASDYSYSTYSIPTYTISYDKGSNTYTGGNSISGSKSDESKTCGTDYALPSSAVFTATGYTQTGWATEDGGSKVYELGDDYTTNSAQEFFPFWTAKTTTVSFNQNSGSGGQTSSMTATYGSAMPTPITTPTRTGYDFDGYYDGAGGAGTKYYNNDGTSARNWDKENATWTLSAKWTATDYIVTYSNPGNSNSYSISVDGGSAGSENKTAHYGNTITLTASAYTGYAFSSWTIKKTSDNSDVTASVSLSGQTSTASFTMPDYGVTVIATFNVAATYAVTVDKNADYGTVTGAGSYASGATVNISATPYGGYEFVNWTTSDGVTFANANSASTSFTMIGSAVTVQANFRAETCEREWVLQAETNYITLTRYHDAMPSGLKIIPTDEEAYNEYTGYTGTGYADWKSTAGAIYFHVDLPAGTYNFTIRNNNCYGDRFINIYKVGADALDGHSVEYNSKTYGKVQSENLGQSQDGKSFSDYGWNNRTLEAGDYIIGYYAPAQWTALDKITITKTNTYTVSYNATGAATGSTISAAASGSGLASGSSVDACTEVTFTATPASGYEVEHWKVGGVTYAAADGQTTFALAINRNVTVTYTTVAKTYTVTLDDGGAETSSSASVTMTYGSGSHTAITNPVQSGYTFDGWYTGEGGTGTLVINSSGVLQNSTAYTDGSGNWNYDGEPTLYAGYTVEGGGGGSQYCDYVMTATDEATTATFSFTHPSTNTYIVTIHSDNANFTGLRGEGNYCHVNDAGTNLQIKQSSDFVSWDNTTKTLTITLTSTGGYSPYFYTPFYLNFSEEKIFNTLQNQSFTWPESCGATTYTVTYDGNGADGGSVPVDAWSPYVSGATVTVLGNRNSLTNGDNPFLGWNTAVDGSGTTYKENDTFEITEDVTLYAKWTSSHDITYSVPSNGSYTIQVGDASPVSANTTANNTQIITLSATPANACYEFSSWTVTGATSGDAITVTNNQFTMPNEDVTVAASFVQKNLAKNKTVRAGWSRTVNEANASEVPEKAVDGDLNSHHIQWAINDNFATKGWWAVDLGDKYVLSDIKIYWQADQDGRAPRSYEIQAAITTPSDFENDRVMSDDRWHTIKTVSGVTQYTGSTANVLSFTVGEHAVARYLRIVNKDADRKPMAISEFEVYGTGTENCYAANTPTASFVGIVDGQIQLNLSATNTNGDALSNFAVLYGGVYYDVTASEGVGALTLPTHRDITVRVYAYNTCMERSTGYVDVAVGDYVNPVDNLAELKTTWVSYTNNNADEKQANLNDGILDNNGWIPYQNTGTNAWMVVDLGDTYQISSVETFFATGRKSTNYKIYGRQEDPVTDDVRGDNTQWVELASKSSSINSGATESDVNESAVTYTGAIRYVRFESFAEEWADAENGFKLLEFRVFGSVFKSRDVTGPTWTDANCAVTSAVGNTITMTLEATDTHPEHVYNFTINVSDGSSNRNYERSTTAMSNEITITDAELIASCQSYTVTATCYDDAGNASTPKEFSNVVPSIVAETNLAIGKTATAGTTQGGYVAGNAIDDNNTTMWSGNYERNDGVNQWIYVNLGKRYDLSKIHIRWGDNSNTWPQDYELQVSNDGSVFAPVAHYTSVSANQANDYVVSDVTAQYVRVWANKAGSTYGMEMQELKVYGDCETDTDLPIMLFAEALDDDVYVTAADIYVGAIHKSIASNQLLYHVVYTDNTNGSYSGSRTFTAAEVTNGRFQLDNLQSGHSYTVTIYAAKTSDIAENRSENYKTVSFTTKAIGAYSKYYMANSINGWLAVNAGEWTDAMNAWRFQNTAVNGLYRLQHTVSTTEQWTYLLYDQPNALRTTPSDRKLNVTSGRDVIMTMRGLNEYVSNYHTLYIAGEAVGTAANDLTYSLTWTDATHASWTGYVTEGQNFGLIFPDPCASDANYIRTGVLDFKYSESWPYAKLTFDLDTWTCTWEEADPTECAQSGGAGSGEKVGANTFETGYDVSFKWTAGTPNRLTINATNKDTYELVTGNIYLFFYKTEKSEAIYKEVKLADAARNVTTTIDIPSEVANDEYAYLSVKFERDNKTYITNRMLYNLKGGGCSNEEYFDIYHWDDAPGGARTSYDGGNIVLPIRYFRHFANEDWNTITLPFEVSKVTVYDNGDKREYDLYPRFNNGSKDVEGYYWLKTFSDEVSLGGFKSAWQQLTVTTAGASDAERAANVKPAQGTPYVIAFPDDYGYYENNWVIFHGAAGQTIDADFTGRSSIALTDGYDYNQVQLQANNTMHESDPLSNIYMIEEGFDYFTRRESASVPAFEAYVIGTAQVQTRYSILRYTGEEENIPDVMDQPTGIENTPPTTAGYDGEVYTVAGIRVAGFANRDEMETLLNNLGAGVYIVRMGTQINKVVVY